MPESRLSIQEYCRVAAQMPKADAEHRGKEMWHTKRQEQRARQALADDVGHRLVVEHAVAEIAAG